MKVFRQASFKNSNLKSTVAQKPKGVMIIQKNSIKDTVMELSLESSVECHKSFHCRSYPRSLSSCHGR